MKRALNLDPLSHEMMADFCRFLYYARRYDEALTQCKAALEIDPNDVDALAITGDLYCSGKGFGGRLGIREGGDAVG